MAGRFVWRYVRCCQLVYALRTATGITDAENAYQSRLKHDYYFLFMLHDPLTQRIIIVRIKDKRFTLQRILLTVFIPIVSGIDTVNGLSKRNHYSSPSLPGGAVMISTFIA
jgi:hypothetical protein